jgi:hypothetical protein
MGSICFQLPPDRGANRIPPDVAPLRQDTVDPARAREVLHLAARALLDYGTLWDMADRVMVAIRRWMISQRNTESSHTLSDLALAKQLIHDAAHGRVARQQVDEDVLACTKLYRVGPNCETWSSISTANPYSRPKVGPQFGPTLCNFRSYRGRRCYSARSRARCPRFV